MYICVYIIFTEVAHENSARSTLAFQTAFHLADVGAVSFFLTVWCQLVVTEAYERQSSAWRSGAQCQPPGSAQVAENLLFDPSLSSWEGGLSL